jgi:hypothetical protein
VSERGGERGWLGGAAVFCIVMLTGFVCAGLLVTDAVEVEEEEAEAPAKEEAQDEGSQQIDDTSFDTRGELAEREWPSLVVLGVEGPALL